MSHVACMPHLSLPSVQVASHAGGLISKLSPVLITQEREKSAQKEPEVLSFCMSCPSRNLIALQAAVSSAELGFHALLPYSVFYILSTFQDA